MIFFLHTAFGNQEELIRPADLLCNKSLSVNEACSEIFLGEILAFYLQQGIFRSMG